MTCNLDNRACLLRQAVNRRQGGFPTCTGCKTGAVRYASARKVEKKIKERSMGKKSVCDVCGREMKIAAKGLCSSCYAYHNRGELTRKGSGWEWQVEPPEWAASGLEQEHVSMVVLGSVADEAALMDEEHEIQFSGEPLDRFDDAALVVDDNSTLTPAVHRGCLLIDGKRLPILGASDRRSLSAYVSVCMPKSSTNYLSISAGAVQAMDIGDDVYVEFYGDRDGGVLYLLLRDKNGDGRFRIGNKSGQTSRSIYCSSVIRCMGMSAGRYPIEAVDGRDDLYRVLLDEGLAKEAA